ncbi:MAG: exodeoxyribonuclease V subunit beta [gamma proteobacterium symbiont of Bathyaustriella thionipta]|nr:exodeoxyribonuclease V subunit beta [gamma proteobacterium symbiont of Bathyaustriella thionipta]
MNTPLAFKPLDTQQTLQLDLHGVKLIEASAGTGKTYTIANLYLRYILSGYAVSEILVVTFTNAAADELRGRIRKRLYETLQQLQQTQDSQDDFLNQLLQQLQSEDKVEEALKILKFSVRSMDEAAIYTIHGFCQRALTDHAFNSGQMFELEMTTDDHPLWLQALTDWWRKTFYLLTRQQAELFLQTNGTMDDFIEQQKLLRESEQLELLPEVSLGVKELLGSYTELEQDYQSLADHWKKKGAEIIALFNASGIISKTKKLPWHKDNIEKLEQDMHAWSLSSTVTQAPEQLPCLAWDFIQNAIKASQKDKSEEMENYFFTDCQQLQDKIQKLQQQLTLASLNEATDFARSQIKRVKKQSGILSFHDQLTQLHAALQSAQGHALAQHIRTAHPVAMIDEFQDTDPLQYAIFKQLYQQQEACSLIMIGDPKQAIYSFRGADIFTYMQAKAHSAEQAYTLETNWRSSAELIKAVNSLFQQQKNPFIYAQAIRFYPVQPADKHHIKLYRNAEECKPLSLWHIQPEKDKKLSKTIARERVARAVAAEIAILLGADTRQKMTLDEQNIQARDIAVLVRDRYEAQDIAEALRAAGIASASKISDKVYSSDEAKHLLHLLQAVIHYSDRSAARAALATPLAQLGYPQIADCLFDEQQWSDWLLNLQQLNQIWRHKGFMSMFQGLLNTLDMGQRMAAGALAERRLTNLLQLAELLQQASATYPHMDALLNWYQQQLESCDSEEAELRLESDAQRVTISTIHSCKGLQYPIVFVPFAWACRKISLNQLYRLHDDQQQAFIKLLQDTADTDYSHIEKEQMAEDMRLLYVALTRAECKLYLAWGHIHTKNGCDSGSSALGQLLHGLSAGETLNEPLIASDLEQLSSRAQGQIEIMPLPDEPARQAPACKEPMELLAATFQRSLANDWRTNSFSNLTRAVHQTPHGGSPRSGHDSILDFPAGSQVGLFLHLLLENLDFQADIETQSQLLFDTFAPRYHLHQEAWRPIIGQWLKNIVSTPINLQGLQLSALSSAQRLNELEFDFSTETVNIQQLETLLNQQAGYTLPPLGADNFKGLVKGIIDLVFEYQGRYYLADYKSNFLGGALSDYAPEPLQQAMLDRRYDLQYLLYTLALHRYLHTRIKDYQYRQHFGGVYYLFLRAMRADNNQPYGIYSVLPDEKLIQTLDEKILSHRVSLA